MTNLIHRDYYNEHEELGHTGGGIGAGCILGYFMDSDTYYFIGINLGDFFYAKSS
jgi:D-alanyl-D-alanine carboxypeptidase